MKRGLRARARESHGQRAERPAPRTTRPIDRLTHFYGEHAIAHAYLACTTEQPFDLAPGITVSGWPVWPLEWRWPQNPITKARPPQ